MIQPTIIAVLEVLPELAGNVKRNKFKRPKTINMVSVKAFSKHWWRLKVISYDHKFPWPFPDQRQFSLTYVGWDFFTNIWCKAIDQRFFSSSKETFFEWLYRTKNLSKEKKLTFWLSRSFSKLPRCFLNYPQLGITSDFPDFSRWSRVSGT